MTTLPTRPGGGLVIAEYGDHDFSDGWQNGWAVYDRTKDPHNMDHVFVSYKKQDCEIFVEGWKKTLAKECGK